MIQVCKYNSAEKSILKNQESPSRAYQANSAFHPSVVGKWGPALAGKEKAVFHSVSRWTRGVEAKLRFLENACHTWAP